MLQTLTCRPASADDVAVMARLRERSGWAGGAGAETMRRYLVGEHHPRQARAPRAAFVGERAGELVGFVAGHLTERFGCDGEVQWLLVAPAARGESAATALLQALAMWFTTKGAARVCVNVAPENARARRFYSRHGAVELSEYWMVWPDIAAAGRRTAAPVPRESIE